MIFYSMKLLKYIGKQCFVSIKASAQFFQLKATGTISSFGRHLTDLNMHDDPYFTKLVLTVCFLNDFKSNMRCAF